MFIYRTGVIIILRINTPDVICLGHQSCLSVFCEEATTTPVYIKEPPPLILSLSLSLSLSPSLSAASGCRRAVVHLQCRLSPGQRGAETQETSPALPYVPSLRLLLLSIHRSIELCLPVSAICTCISLCFIISIHITIAIFFCSLLRYVQPPWLTPTFPDH